MMMNWSALVSFICSLSVVLTSATVVHKTSCEQECSVVQKNGFKGPKLLHDIHCHRGCRLFRIMYMLSSPLMGKSNVLGECSQSCRDSYSDALSRSSCVTGCQIQEGRLSQAPEIHNHLSVIGQHAEGGGVHAYVQHLQRYLALFGASGNDPSLKRLCSWTVISAHNVPRIVIFKTERVGRPSPGHMLMADVTAQREELQFGGARPEQLQETPVRKKHDLWWICVIERTLQPLMAGLLLLSVLILLWLCFTSVKDAPTNAKELIVPNEVGSIKFRVHSPQCVEPTQEKSKTSLLKVPLEDV